MVVVGGGLIGATLVHALHGAPLRTAWVERRPVAELPDDPRSTALAQVSARLLQDLGLWDAISDDACAIETVKVSQQGHFGSVTLSASDMGVPALGYVVPNRALASALAASVVARSDVLDLSPDALASLSEDDDGVLLTLESGRQIRASLVVAADGGHSRVRDCAGVALGREVAFDQHAVVAEITGAGWPPHVAWERFCPYGPLALLPLDRNRLSVVYTVPDAALERVVALDDAAFMQEVGERSGLTHHFVSVTPRQAFPLVAVSAESAWQGRIVLIGNAVRTLHPVAGQGFNLALRDCLTLAELLRELGPDADPAAPHVASQYRRRRGADQRRTAFATEGLARLFRGESTVLGHLRGAGLLLTDRFAPARRTLARQFMGLGGRLPLVKSPD